MTEQQQSTTITITLPDLMTLVQVLLWQRAGLLELRQAVEDSDGLRGTAVLAIVLEHPRVAADVVTAEQLCDRILAAAAPKLNVSLLRESMQQEMRAGATERVVEYTGGAVWDQGAMRWVR